MLIRAIALSIALLIGVGTLLPLATETTEAGPRHSKRYKKRHHKYRKYSKRWWRQYHARMRKRRALARRRRALRLRQLRLARAHQAAKPNGKAPEKKMMVKTSAVVEQPSLLPSGDQAPSGWKKVSMTPGELRFGVSDSSGQQIGSASITVVGPSMGATSSTSRNRSLAGVPVASLRRDVINRMIGENGWVVNDYQKEVNGSTVYVVVAQSQNGGRVSARTFYFAEVDGRIYSVSTTSSPESAERLSEESEKVINSLQHGRRSTQRAALQE